VHVRIATAIGIVLLAAFCGPGSADGASAPRGPSQAVSGPVRASTAVVRWATSWQAQAGKNRRALSRVRACFGLSRTTRLPASPGRSASGEDWTDWGRRCKALAVRYHRSFVALRYRMAHPSRVVSTSTWRPLVRWYWPASQVEYALVIMRRESGGQPRAYNQSGCAGLFQLSRYWYSSKWDFDPFDPEQNVKHAAMVWRLCDWHAWVTAW